MGRRIVLENRGIRRRNSQVSEDTWVIWVLSKERWVMVKRIVK